MENTNQTNSVPVNNLPQTDSTNVSPKRSNKRKILIGILLGILIGGFILVFIFLFGLKSVGLQLGASKIEPTRMVVIKPAQGAVAPFSLETHTIAIPDNFVQLSENRGHLYLDVANLTFSPDGTRAAYLARFGIESYVVVDNKAFKIQEKFSSGRLDFKFSDDSNSLFFILYLNIDQLKSNGSVLVMKNRNSDSLVFSDALHGGNTTYTIGSQHFPMSDMVIQIPQSIQSSDGKKTAFVEITGSCGPYSFGNQVHVIVSEGSQQKFKSKNYSCGQIDNLVFEPNGQRVAYRAVPANQVLISDGYGNFVAINDQPGQTFGAFANGSIRFSPDGKYIAYGAAREDKLWWIVEEVVPDPNNQTVQYLKDIKLNIVKDGAAWRILHWGYEYKIYSIPYPANWNLKTIIDKEDSNTDLYIFPGESMNEKDFIHVKGAPSGCDVAKPYVKCAKLFDDNMVIIFTNSNDTAILEKFDALVGKYDVPKSASVTVNQNNIDEQDSNWKTYTKGENPTDGWINFQNLAEGFEIKRPGNWNSEENVWSKNPGKSTDLVFCPNTLADPGKVNCKKDASSGYPKGMIYLYSSLTPTGNADYHYIGINKTGRHYYLYNDLADKTIFNKIIASFKFIP